MILPDNNYYHTIQVSCYQNNGSDNNNISIAIFITSYWYMYTHTSAAEHEIEMRIVTLLSYRASILHQHSYKLDI